MTKQSNFAEQLRRARGRLPLQRLKIAVKGSEVEVIASSTSHVCGVSILAKHNLKHRRKESTKRQRTSSTSSPSDSKIVLANLASDDEDENGQKPREGGQNKIRGAAARNQRNKELREKEEKREQERTEAASRRKARSERRKADGKGPSLKTNIED